MYLLIFWFLLVLGLSVYGAFDQPSAPAPFGAIVAIALPVTVFFLGRKSWTSGPFKSFYALDKSTVVAFQAYRMVGAFFLVECYMQRLAPGFGVPAGIGDMLIGFSAPIVASSLRMEKSYARKLALIWNGVGLLDLATAIGLGALLPRSSANLPSAALSVQWLFQYPLSIIPTFFVPISLILHLQSIQTLLSIRTEGGAGHALGARY